MLRSRHAKADLLEPQPPQLGSIAARHGFAPDYSPIRMLKLGVFGGNYFADAKTADYKDMKPALVKHAVRNGQIFWRGNNCFGVKAGLSYDEWLRNGWIFDEDPLGWFHWYCRFYSGRRHARDAHQINRWIKYKDRWSDRAASQLKANGKISPTIMQGLLQWGIDPYLGGK